MHPLFTSAFVVIFASLANSHYERQVINSSKDFKVELGMFENDTFVSVTCNCDLWTNFPTVDLDRSSASVFIFETCSFPPTLNVQSIVDSMSIRVKKEFRFRRFQSIPSRKNLEGISVPNLDINVIRAGDVPFDLLYDKSNLRSLSLNARLVRIPDSFYADWAQNISVVDMRYNKLRKIARSDFARLVNVKDMNLFSNAIDEIEPKAFDSLINVNSLDLSLNHLHILPLGIFHRMINLTKINMGINSFDELSPDLFENNKNLEEFAMDANKGNLTTLPRGFFKTLIHLKTISLQRGQWESLPSDLFVGCSSLDYLNLVENKLTSLPSGIFKDTENLRRLDISKNHLESLPAGIFKGLGRLKHLLISNNKLTSLTSEDLQDLESLEFLDASLNRLKWIDHQFITYLKSANHIDLSTNQLTFENQVNVESSKYQINGTFINASEKQNNQQCSLDPSVKLKRVILSYNRISQFKTELINILKYSAVLDLRYNSISKMNLFELSSQLALCNVTNSDDGMKYRKIYLDSNPFHCDCNILQFVNYLKDPNRKKLFYVLASEFDKFNKGFKCASPPHFKNHEIVDLPTEELDCSFKTTTPGDACTKTCVCRQNPEKRVLSVDCSNRNLTRIPSTIGNMHNFSIELNMTGNKLQDSPSLRGSYLTNVTSLDLSNNNIATVTLDLFSPNLRQLRLQGNRISHLDSKVIENLERNDILRDFTLHDNRWICDCEARGLVTFVQKKFTKYNFHEMMCHGTNKKLYKMALSELCKNTIVVIGVASFFIVLFAIFIASSVVLYYKYQREIKVWLYSKQWCLWLVTEDELDKDKEYDAFISFSHKDEDFVEKEIVAKLEKGPRPYKLCLHYRDWLAGEWIPVQISRSVEASRRTIVILTPNFLESVWGLMEFRAAHTQALKEGRNRLIVILHGEIGNVDDLDQEMKDYLRLNTYIKWGDPWFWDKLRYALPHAKDFAKKKLKNVVTVENRLIQFPLINGCGSDAAG